MKLIKTILYGIFLTGCFIVVYIHDKLVKGKIINRMF